MHSYFPSCGLELSLILATAQEQLFYFKLIFSTPCPPHPTVVSIEFSPMTSIAPD